MLRQMLLPPCHLTNSQFVLLCEFFPDPNPSFVGVSDIDQSSINKSDLTYTYGAGDVTILIKDKKIPHREHVSNLLVMGINQSTIF